MSHPIAANRRILGDVTDRANQLIDPPAGPLNASTKTSAKPTKSGTKRKAAETPNDVDLDSIDLEGAIVDADCNQVRRKIRTLFESGEMKIGEFCNAIAVSNKSLNDFLGKNGKYEGSGSNTYYHAWEFFKKREIAGIKPAKKPRATAKSTASAAATASTASAPIDLRGISLSGEASDAVPVFDSCDEVRKKINAHLMKGGMTAAQFMRELEAQLHCSTRKIQSKQLTDFRSKKGAGAGNTSIVFYTAYVYFEKLRLAEGKPKSKQRLGMEGTHPFGFDIQRPSSKKVWCPKGAKPYEDAFGRIMFS